MTETPARKPGPRRTFSAFGDVRRMPSEYEIVTQGQNWTLRPNRAATFEQNPSSAANLWFLTYRENSPLKAENWDASPLADDAALRLGKILAAAPGSSLSAADVADHARTGREDFLAGLLDTARENGTARAG